MKQLNSLYAPPLSANEFIKLGINLEKGLWISFSDNGTPYDYDNKVFTNAKEALIAYRKFKKISKYKIQFSKCWAFYQLGRLTWLQRYN